MKGGDEGLGVWDWHVHTAVFKIGNKPRSTVTAQGSQYSAIT